VAGSKEPERARSTYYREAPAGAADEPASLQIMPFFKKILPLVGFWQKNFLLIKKLLYFLSTRPRVTLISKNSRQKIFDFKGIF
jgi:hypothetical protein